MKTHRFILLVLILSCVTATIVTAQNSRSAVSINGFDTNTCTVPQPCRTFAAALAVTNSGGEILALDSGGYGPFTINKAVSVRAIPGAYAGIAPSSGSAITINAGSTDTVLLAGLTLNSTGATYGINVQSAGVVFVDRCEVNAFSGNGLFYSPVASGELYINDSTFRNNSGTCCAALMLLPSSPSKVAIDHLRAESNYTAINVRENARVSIRNSELVGNTSDAVFVGAFPPGTTAELNVVASVLANNAFGITANLGTTYSGSAIASITDSLVANNNTYGLSTGTAGTIRVSSTTITRNLNGVAGTPSGPIISFGNNRLHGNSSDGTFNQLVPLQ